MAQSSTPPRAPGAVAGPGAASKGDEGRVLERHLTGAPERRWRANGALGQGGWPNAPLAQPGHARPGERMAYWASHVGPQRRSLTQLVSRPVQRAEASLDGAAGG